MKPSPELIRNISRLLKTLGTHGILEKNRKMLANGVQMGFSDGDSECRCNLYYSRKKGFSIVPSGGSDELVHRIRNLSGGGEEEAGQAETDENWIGSDEAGKGDYMGPLTVAAVFVDRRTAEEFRSMGIADSKNLTDSTILRLAAEIHGKFKGGFAVVSIPPAEYNRWFRELVDRGANSLDLLAQCHADAINRLLSTVSPPDRILIDRFAPEKRVAGLLAEGDYRLELRERAESDPAVAAASVLARARYLEGLDEISQKYGIRAVSGSGRATDEVCREFVRRYGADVLESISKLHFRNTGKVVDLFTSI